MQVEPNDIYEIYADLPRSLSKIDAKNLLAAIWRHPQGRGHSETVHQLIAPRPEVEVLNASNDLAILRVCPTFSTKRASQWLVGYADEGNLFIHNLPFGQLDYEGEDLPFVLRWINRIEDGFTRVQGDLLLQPVEDSWEIERLEDELKENVNDHPYRNSFASLGNNHTLTGDIVEDSIAPWNQDREIVVQHGGQERPVEMLVAHTEHRSVQRPAGKRKRYSRVALQRRGNEADSGAD